MKFFFTLLALVLGYPFIASASAVVGDRAPSPFPGADSIWETFDRHDFQVDGMPVIVVAPKKLAPGNPWLWRGEFFGIYANVDIELLKHGFYVVYLKAPDLFGCPDAVARWDKLYDELVGKYGFAKKPVLLGMSRGGFYCYNWAIAHPDRVSCIYGDAPVCDFKSWPGGKGKSSRETANWRLLLACYHFKDEAEALAYNGNPIDNLAPLAAARVPLLNVYGEADVVVPPDENTLLLAARYRALGGDITLIAKPGVGHHPHGLEDPTPIVAYILKHTDSQ